MQNHTHLKNLAAENALLKKRLTLLEQENKILMYAVRSPNFDVLFSKIINFFAISHGFESGIFSLVLPENNAYVIRKIKLPEKYFKVEAEWQGAEIKFHMKDDKIYEAIQTKKNVLFNYMEHSQAKTYFEEKLFIQTYVNIPLIISGKVRAVISLISHDFAIYIDNECVDDIEYLINKISLIIIQAIHCNTMEHGRAFLMNLLEHSPIGVFVIDKNENVIFSNPAIEKFKIFSFLETPDKKWRDFKNVFDNKLDVDFKNTLKGKTVKKENLALYSESHKGERLYNFTFTPISNELSNNDKVLVLCHDNTEKALAEKMITKDLQLARNIQKSVISNDLNAIDDIKIHVCFQPMIEVGGDIYDIFKLKDKVYRIFIADATGHGIQASLTTMLIKAEYDKIKIFEISPNIVLKIFNNVFCDNYHTLNVFFTCAILDIDLERNEIRYSSAGNPRQFLIRDNLLFNLSSSGTMVGVLKNMEYQIVTAEFVPGSKILLFTDGIFEEFSEDEVMYDLDKLFSAIEKSRTKPVSDIVNNIMSDVKQWMGNTPVNDDITLIGIEYKKKSA